MYRQILVRKEDQKYQHIWWRFASTEPIKKYELRTVTYGMSPSPHQALRVLKQLVEDEGELYPLASKTLFTSMT